MPKIADYIPKDHPVVTAIYNYHKQRGDSEPYRGYLGASIIGHHCERYLWYVFRACCKPEFNGRMYRLFETGNLAEGRLIDELMSIGCEVHAGDDNGNQFKITDFGDHFSGHLDGCAIGIPGAPKTWHVLEFKTHNVKSFTKLVKEGVVKSKPVHYAQMQIYMHKTGMKRALYLAVNKNTDELYAERVKYNKAYAESLAQRAERIITATSPPERLASHPDYWECKLCDAQALCWGSPHTAFPIPAINCRQCCHATPTMAGQANWVCEKQKRGLSEADQNKACDNHLVLPGLISFAEPTGSGKVQETEGDYIEYTNKDGSRWANGGHHSGLTAFYSSKELQFLPISALTNQTVTAAKELFGAKATGHSPDDILSRYPEEDSRIIWTGKASGLTEAWEKRYGVPVESEGVLAKIDTLDYKAVEFHNNRVAIVWPNRKAQIREGIE
jgi:hypothetical protein